MNEKTKDNDELIQILSSFYNSNNQLTQKEESNNKRVLKALSELGASLAKPDSNIKALYSKGLEHDVFYKKYEDLYYKTSQLLDLDFVKNPTEAK